MMTNETKCNDEKCVQCGKVTHASELNDHDVCARCAEPLAILRVVRNSDELGLDVGMVVHVLHADEHEMHVYVPALDAVIAGVACDHPDLAPRTPRAPLSHFVVVRDGFGDVFAAAFDEHGDSVREQAHDVACDVIIPKDGELLHYGLVLARDAGEARIAIKRIAWLGSFVFADVCIDCDGPCQGHDVEAK